MYLFLVLNYKGPFSLLSIGSFVVFFSYFEPLVLMATFRNWLINKPSKNLYLLIATVKKKCFNSKINENKTRVLSLFPLLLELFFSFLVLK